MIDAAERRGGCRIGRLAPCFDDISLDYQSRSRAVLVGAERLFERPQVPRFADRSSRQIAWLAVTGQVDRDP